THGESISMKIAMAALVVICFVIGIWPLTVYGALSKVTAILAGHDYGSAQIQNLFSSLPIANVVVVVAVIVTSVIIAIKVRRSSKAETWDCGYAEPTARMQYTASSFAGPLVGLFGWALRPELHEPSEKSLFPKNASFESHVPDPILDRLLVPAISRWRNLMEYARVIQAGRIQVYIVYVVATLLILLIWSAL
ncbi:hypothetical protein L0152_32990, partial [bacterium]|nr:hypothetical protein [bacterium]